MSFQIQLGEGQCKCLVNVANSKRHLFAAATENTERLNEIRLIEFSEVESTIKELIKVPFDGNIEKIVNQKDQLFTISRYQNNKFITQLNSSLEKVFQIQYDNLTNILPHESDPILYLTTPTQIDLFDLNKQASNNIYTSTDSFKLCQQDPYHQNLFARTQEGQLCIQDIRDKKQGLLFKAHALNILDIDFNPNKQYYLMTAGEDCMCKIWDIRKTDFAMKTLSDLTNSVLQAKFNRFHDQLVSLACIKILICAYIHQHKNGPQAALTRQILKEDPNAPFLVEQVAFADQLNMDNHVFVQKFGVEPKELRKANLVLEEIVLMRLQKKAKIRQKNKIINQL